MTETGRIRVARDKADLVKSLTSIDGERGPFQTYADVIVFAAALGAKHDKRVTLGEISKREPSPIPQEQLIVRGYDRIINLLAVNVSGNIKEVIVDAEQSENIGNLIFEEYANGGLEILQKELVGSVDHSERLMLLLSLERFKKDDAVKEFDLSKFTV